MAKRVGDFDNNTNKRFKANDDINDLWGEDPDIDDVDDCILLATQAVEQNFSCTQRNNVTILPTYNAFKQDQHVMFTSTQATQNFNVSAHLPKNSTSNGFGTNKPSSTNKPFLTNKALSTNNPCIDNISSNTFKRPLNGTDNASHDLEMKIQKMQELLEAKEGEASILRSQLKQNKASIEAENAKKQLEWTEKLNITTKQMNAYKTELEFKNLEISNLKQKIIEVSKFIPSDSTPAFHTPTKFRGKTGRQPETLKSKTNENDQYFRLKAYPENIYPLKILISPTIFNVPEREVCLESYNFSSTARVNIPFLGNQTLQEKTQNTYPKTILENKRELDIDFVFEDIGVLRSLSSTEISLEIYNSSINKIMCTCHQLIHNFNSYLQQVENCMQTENIRRLDTLYLENKLKTEYKDSSIFGSKEWCENEKGIKCRQLLAFISELLPHSIYLQNYLLNKEPLTFKEYENYQKYFSVISIHQDDNKIYDNFNFLNLILSVVKIIGRIRKSYKCPGILSAITLLLSRICATPFFNQIHEIIMKIFKEIVFSRPNNQVLCYLSEFLKEASLQDIFNRHLCKMSSINGLRTVSKQGVVYFNEDSCIFQVFCTLYEENILTNTQKYITVNFNVLKFILNVFNSKAKWLHYQENNHCDCLSKINKLSIEILYESLEIYKNDYSMYDSKVSDEVDKFYTLFQYGIEILSILNFKSYDLMEKCITTYSQYKDIICSLLKLQHKLSLSESDVESLEQLNVAEDPIPMETDCFNMDIFHV